MSGHARSDRPRRESRSIAIAWGVFVGGGIVVGIAVGLVLRSLRSPGAEPDEGEPEEKAQPEGSTDLHTPSDPRTGSSSGGSHVPRAEEMRRVLIVLVHDGFWYPDYIGVRRALEERGAHILVASTSLSPASPHEAGGGTVVTPDRLIETVRPEELDAVIICGAPPERIVEFMGDREAARTLRRLLFSLRERRAVVSAICGGPAVLADAGLVDGRRVTCHSQVVDLVAPHVREIDSTSPVVVEDGIITGRDPEAAVLFAETVLEELAR